MSGRGWLTVAFLSLVLAVLYQGFHGRQEIVDSQRRACERGVVDRVVHRDQALASYRANLIVSEDPDQPAKTRLARGDQAQENMRAVVSFESRMPRSERRTRAGQALPEFNCGKVVPPARVIGAVAPH